MGGLLSHYQQTAQKQYSSDPANFAVGQNKIYDELSPVEKATSLLHGFAKKTADVAVGAGKQILETGTALADIGYRLSPLENLANTVGGMQEVAKQTPGVPSDIAYQKGFTESQARPLMFEKLTGQQLQNPDGSVNWDFARKFVGRAMEGPTYAYAGGTIAADKLVGKGLLSRIVSRTAANLPFAGVNTAIQAGEQGNTENIGTNFLINALILSGISNVAGEIKFPTQVLNKAVSDIEMEIGKITPEQKLYVQDALKQGVKSDEILTNIQKVKAGQVTPDEVASIVNKQVDNAKAPSQKEPSTLEPTTVPKEKLDATSVASYINKDGVKVTTPLSKRELEILADEVRTIPTAKDGNSQIHLDANTPVLADAIKSGEAKTVSREDFVAGHPQAQSVFDKTVVKPDTGGATLSQPKEIVAAIEAPKVEPTAVKVPQENLPVGTGKEKVSRLEARVTDNLKAMTPEQRDAIGLSTYNEMNKKENIAAAVDYITKNPSDGIKILSGEMQPPKGVLKNSIYVAMDSLAHEDAALGQKLASLSSTRAGQELSILTEINPDSPVSVMRELSQTKIQAVEKKLKSGSVEKTRTEMRTGIEKGIKKLTPTKQTWQNFIEGITCKS